MKTKTSKVLLLLSPVEYSISCPGHFILPPLALGLLSNVLKRNGHEVRLVDLNANLRKLGSRKAKENIAFLYSKDRYLRILAGDGSEPEVRIVEELLKGIDVSQFDLIGISLGSEFSFLQIHLGFLIGAVLKKRFGKQVIFGGNNVRYLYLFKEFFRDLWNVILPMFPRIIQGPGETALLSLLGGPPDSEIPGGVYLENNEIRCHEEGSPCVSRPDFETLDMGLYGVYLEPENGQVALNRNLSLLYKHPGHLAQAVNSDRFRLNAGNYERKMMIPYIFNYGCPYRCAFCTQSGSKKDLVNGDIHRVLDDLQYLMERWQSKYFYFLNNAFNSSPAFADSFCAEVLRRGMHFLWSDCGRFNNMTEERIIAMRKAGCRKITFGFETGSPAMLRYIDKRIELAQAERVLEWCKKHDIWADLEVIVGLPYETDPRFRETMDFIERNRSRISNLAENEYFVVPNSLIGLHPERYQVELVKDLLTYEQLLTLNHAALSNGQSMNTDNFRVHRYNETTPYRGHKDIKAAALRNLEIVKGFRSEELKEARRTYQTIDCLRLAASGGDVWGGVGDADF